MNAPNDVVVIGRVVKPHGLKGEVVVQVLTDFPGRFFEGLKVTLSGAGASSQEGRISGVRSQRDRLLVTFEGISDVDAAEKLRNVELSVSTTDVVPRPEGYVYHWEIEGAAVVDASGRTLGRVLELADAGGRPLLVLETPRGPRDVPFARPIVVSVDVAGRRIVLDPPHGLLD